MEHNLEPRLQRSPAMVRPDHEHFKIQDASSYDGVATSFDRFTRKFTPPIAGKLATLANLQPGMAVLDVGTGTGVVALEAGARVAPRGRVIGVDLSEGMLAVARESASRSDGHIEFRRMDAENLAFSDSSFDSVVSLFALLHFPAPLRALMEMYRVLRPGGSLALAVGSRPPLSTSGLVHRLSRIPFLLEYLRGRVLIAPAFLDELVTRHIPESTAAEETELASHDRNRSFAVPRLVKQAGFSSVSVGWQGFEAVLTTIEEFWDVQCTYSSIARKRLAVATSAQRRAIEAEFASRCEGVINRAGRLVYTYAALFVSARRSQ
jgi:ubiquinone/menaquinone biosynthesis C-methylase UbiE